MIEPLRPNPQLLALANEPSAVKRAVRFLWQMFLLVTGRLVLAFKEAVTRLRPTSPFFCYTEPIRLRFKTDLTALRSPPRPA